MRRASARIPLVMAILAASALLACSSPEKELRKAKAAGTVEALDAFLARHPDGPLAEQAKDAKEQLFLDAAKTTSTQAAFSDFLKRYPNGKLAGAARAAIEALDFKDVQAAGTIEAYDGFVRLHPQSAFAKKATEALDRLLPGGLYATVEVASTDPNRCTVFATVTILHKTGALTPEAPPAVEPGTMLCGSEVGKSGVEIVKVEPRDANHTLLHVKTFSTSGWSECRGTCTARFFVQGQEQVVTAVYK
jgi:hypothetical protein